MYSSLFVAAAVLGLLLSGGAPSTAATPKPVTHTVVIEGMQFDPPVVTVKVGDIIVWINRDPFPHTATAHGGAV